MMIGSMPDEFRAYMHLLICYIKSSVSNISSPVFSLEGEILPVVK